MGMTVARRGEVRREEKLERETREWERLLLAHPPPLSTPAKQATQAGYFSSLLNGHLPKKATYRCPQSGCGGEVAASSSGASFFAWQRRARNE